jgi:hypothetical protein
MTQALTVRETSLEETMQLGDLLAKSGFFADSKGAAQAVVKVLAGREIGFGPIASMTGIHVIQGRVSLSANLIAAAIKRSGKYDYTVTKMDNTEVVLMFWQRHPKTGEYVEIGESRFTAKDAQAAGTQNMAKFARNMLFARAMSNGAKWYTPDIFGGPVYTPEEMGATVDGETGEVIDAPAPRIVVEQPKPAPATNGQQAQVDPPAEPAYKRLSRPWPANVAIEAIRDTAAVTKNELPDNGAWKALIGHLDGKPFDTQKRHRLLMEVFGVESSKALDGHQRYALHKWASPGQVDGVWTIDGRAIAEYTAIVNPNRISDEDMDGDFDPVTAGDFIEGPGF